MWAGEPVVVDSSVAFSGSRVTRTTRRLRSLSCSSIMRAKTLIAPALLSLEIANALKCSGVGAAGVRHAMHALADADLLIAPLDPSLIGQAAEVAEADDLTIYDALFVALAQRLRHARDADTRQASTQQCAVRLLGSG